jgi:hypothetical protein
MLVVQVLPHGTSSDQASNICRTLPNDLSRMSEWTLHKRDSLPANEFVAYMRERLVKLLDHVSELRPCLACFDTSC